ncbi:MAG: hypothetical protein WCL30_02165 [Pseudomonadota bacterium]
MTKNINKKIAILAIITTLTAFQANAETLVDKNVAQQQRIEEGLKSGNLNTKEAARLEKGEAQIDKAEAHAMKDGSVSPQEAERIKHLQEAESKRIYKEKHDVQKGNPNSVSSKRMQEDVQRNVNQQQRIDNGVKNGSLSGHEAAALEKGQAKESRREYRAGRNGRIGAGEQNKIQNTDNNQSKKIYDDKHD